MMLQQFIRQAGTTAVAIMIITGLILTGCKKSVTVDAPGNSVSSETVYNEDFTAASVLSGIYATMSNTFNATGPTKIGLLAGLSADELSLFDISNNLYRNTYYNQLTPLPVSDGNRWINIYGLIYRCNVAISGINASPSLSTAAKSQLLGEAKFCRAFFYFYLTNLYGDVPLALSTDYKVNSTLSRSKSADVYQQILTDLQEAQASMGDNYVGNTGSGTSSERVRPSKGSATALLARTYLYLKDYANAEKQSTMLLDNKSLYDTVGTSQVFLKNSKETIWALQPVIVGRNTDDALAYVLPATGPSVTYPFYLNPFLTSAFEPGDKRKTSWVGTATAGGKTYNYAYKYKVNQNGQAVTEYTMVLRLAEQYLIRAEARANQGNLAAALSDLNVIRKRAGLAPAVAASQPDILTAIAKERQVELFTEWGHRWLDLKRTGKVNEVMTVVTPTKGPGTWKPEWQLYAVPNDEILLDNNLTQNPGY